MIWFQEIVCLFTLNIIFLFQYPVCFIVTSCSDSNSSYFSGSSPFKAPLTRNFKTGTQPWLLTLLRTMGSTFTSWLGMRPCSCDFSYILYTPPQLLLQSIFWCNYIPNKPWRGYILKIDIIQCLPVTTFRLSNSPVFYQQLSPVSQVLLYLQSSLPLIHKIIPAETNHTKPTEYFVILF